MGRQASTFVLGLALLLAGCNTAGRDFARPTADSVVLGTTTRAEILQKYGPPARQSSLAGGLPGGSPPAQPAPGPPRDPFDIVLAPGTYVSLTYAFAEKESPVFSFDVNRRAVTFIFWNDRLVAYSFASNFQQDSTDFDEAKISGIEKGKTTKGELRQLLGIPTGRAVYPFVQRPGEERLSYHYTITEMKTLQQRTKDLQVLFSADGWATDYRFGSDVNPVPAPRGNPKIVDPPALF